MRSAARGDGVAFGELVHRFAGEVYRFLAGMLGDPVEAARAMEETFVRVARSAGRYEPDTDVRAFVFGNARKVAEDLRPTPSAAPEEALADATDPVDWARRALRALEAGARELVVARDVLGWDDDTIAAVLGAEPGTVSTAIADAREAMMRAGSLS